MTFAGFGLAKPITDALARAGFETPTPIQAQAIGPQLEGRDILGLAQTGTGKTAAFALPILHHILGMKGRPTPGTARALILAPTRELAVQIQDEFRRFAGGARISTCLVLGGTSRGGQIRMLSRGVDVLIATPGRLTDLVDDRKVRLDEVRFVVLDEADRMLDMGFVKPVKRIVSMLHPRRQSALFSATMPSEISGLVETFLTDPVRVEVAPQSTVAGKVEQSVELMDGPKKRARLAEIVSGPGVERAIVFARTKRGADRVAANLVKDGVAADAIHGNKAQNARQRALGAFKLGKVRVLVATDIAARGIDVKGITHVVNYDLPDEPENYVHRIGRTARNGADGVAVTLCAPDEEKKLRAVEKITGEVLHPDGPAAHRQPRGPRKAANGAPRKDGEQGRPRRRRRRGPPRSKAA
ncbi:DEAD/DEAH box helicase [Pontivivens ytuae]|uniref:DEAD/DEAH box helicase n=1 Tax=Pontivivens ytuae TaxID=2789856 RepID=A0A7S9LVU3_9RHOB|nr:DEAD/DEAH box helicase [Pontivivens ytuae]QPH56251.1 DEAD/DEAH box helicase [Pontivivens ytuae]